MTLLQRLLLITAICVVTAQSMSPAPVKSKRLVDELTSFSTGSNYENRNDDVIMCGSEEAVHKGLFTAYDYTIVIGMLVISIGIGVFYGYFVKSESSDDFLLGSDMTLFPVSLSLTTSFITAIELLGNPSEMFFNGTQFSLIVISCAAVIPVAVKIFYPIYFKLDVTSCYEYLGIRFGTNARILGALLYVLQMSFYTAVAVLAPAIAVSKATGLDTHIAVLLIYVVCIFYSSQGGLKAVVIADTFQAVILALSLVVVLILGHWYTGSAVEVLTTASKYDRLEFFNIDPNPTTRHTVWSIVIGGFFYWTSLFCTNQACVQKCMSLRSLLKAKLALIYSIIGLIIVFLINFYTGLQAFKHYSECDPLKAGHITAKDQLLPYYIMDVFGKIPFMTGLFVAGIFAASLGTVASALSSLAAVTTEDILSAGLGIEFSPKKGAFYGKWISLGFGLLSFALVFLVERLGGILQATLTLNGLIGGVTLGLFSLGIFVKRANGVGALFGGITSLLIVIFLGVMSQIKHIEVDSLNSSTSECDCLFNTTLTDPMKETTVTDISPLYRLSYMWYSLIATALTVIIGTAVSYLTDYFFDPLKTSMDEKPTEDEKPTIATIYSPSTALDATNTEKIGSVNFGFQV